MKITLNLLPKNRRKKIENGKILKLFVWQEGMLIFSALMIIGIAVGMIEFVNVRMESVEAQFSRDASKGNYAEIKKYEESLDEVKTDMIVISKVQKNNINWVPIFQKINESIPNGVAVKSAANEEFRVSLSGIAGNRDQLIDMKNKIEGNDCFRDVSIPINDIVLKDNIDFEVSFNVSKECLVRYEEK